MFYGFNFVLISLHLAFLFHFLFYGGLVDFAQVWGLCYLHVIFLAFYFFNFCSLTHLGDMMVVLLTGLKIFMSNIWVGMKRVDMD